MPWIKLDDHFDEHPKLAGVGPVGLALWVSALAYSNRNLTDGFVPISIARTLIDCSGISVAWFPDRAEDDPWYTTTLVIDELVKVELFDKVDGGYRIHDYSQYQPSKAEVLADRAKKQAAGQAGGKASAQARGQAPAKQVPQQNASKPEAKSNPVPVPVPVPPSSSNEDSGGSARAISENEDALVVYHSLTGRFPTGRVKAWLDEMVTEFGDEYVGKALAVEVTADPSVQTLLSRTTNRLRAAFHEADKRRAERRAKVEIEEREQIEAMPPEQRAANLQRLRDAMAEKGLLAK